MCLFEGNQPYIIGFFQPSTIDPTREIPDLEREGVDPEGGSAAVNKEKINVGDLILRTAGRCRIVLRRGGEIELESTKLCRRTYFPARNLINELSQNYEFRTDGGTIDWIHIDDTSDKTVCRTEYRDDVQRTNVILQDRGTVIRGEDIIDRYQIGPSVPRNAENPEPFTPVFFRTIRNTGQVNVLINQTAYDKEILPDGNTTLGINGFLYFSNIKPTGEVVVNVNSNFQHKVLPSGEMFLDIGIPENKEEDIKPKDGAQTGKFKMNIKPTGNTFVNINGKIDLTLASDGTIKLDSNQGTSVLTIKPDGNTTLSTTKSITCETNTVDVKASFIKLGKGVSDVVPLGKIFLNAVNKFIDAFNTHTHLVPQSRSGVKMSQTPVAPTSNIGEDVLSKTVEVQP
jgi:hypothetical protein